MGLRGNPDEEWYTINTYQYRMLDTIELIDFYFRPAVWTPASQL